jgi:V8-like Glu-specific endopeptidase
MRAPPLSRPPHGPSHSPFCRRAAAAFRGVAVVLLLVLAAAASASAGTPSDRRVIVEAMEYPWSAIGRVNAGGRGYCTGFLIGPRHVMTAAHCLYDFTEGRWRGANELHFVAGYQHDQYLIHSKVASYQAARRFDLDEHHDTNNTVHDWALLTLDEPIGRFAGWLGLMDLNSASLQTLIADHRQIVQAGYRSGRAHAMTVNPGCRVLRQFAEGRGLLHDCAVYPGDSGSPLLLFAGNEVHVIAMEVHLFSFDGQAVGAALAMSTFRRGDDPQADQVLAGAGRVWQGGRLPGIGSPAASLPKGTIDHLLARLGYLAAGSDDDRDAAIRAFEEDQGLAVTGTPSLALMTRLLTVQR